jgi:hypothetical protein
MIRVFVVLVLVIAGFTAGIFFERMDFGSSKEHDQKLELLEQENETLAKKNKNLNETLQLVKRQIQTDRIAYQSIQEIVESSEQDRELLRAQLESQQELLTKLRSKLEESGN